jgi:hypothetical protein
LVNDLETRKKLLIAEGAVYRETLKLEFQNLRIYGIKTRQRLTSFRAGNPVLSFGVPILTSWIARKRKARKWGALAFLGWQLFNRLGPALMRRSTHNDGTQTESSAAEEYLARRM